MDLGDILKIAAQKDMATINVNSKNGLVYREWNEEGCFRIKLSSKYEEAFMECSIPIDDSADYKNYARLNFLSMLYNEMVYSMIKKNRYKKHKLKK